MMAHNLNCEKCSLITNKYLSRNRVLFARHSLQWLLTAVAMDITNVHRPAEGNARRVRPKPTLVLEPISEA
jgi:hypothetical protein